MSPDTNVDPQAAPADGRWAMCQRPLTLADLEALEFPRNAAAAAGDEALLPAVVQHADSGALLMLAYMNREALRATLMRRRVVFWSRSRQRLWEKGESSGHALELVAIHTDCDADALLVTARPRGPVCHTGTASCFGDAPRSRAEPLAFIGMLADIIGERAALRPRGSYTASLLETGARRIAQKVGEEGLEVALAGAAGTQAELRAEAADLLYHLLVLLAAREVPLEEVVAELRARHASA